jgi:hypothetical protein
MVRAHPSTPVYIQQEVERDAAGHPVVAGQGPPALYAPGEPIRLGASISDGDRRGFVGEACRVDEDCGGYPGAMRPRCDPAGHCTQACEGWCPGSLSAAPPFCAVDPETSRGRCLVEPTGEPCPPGTEISIEARFVGHSEAPPTTRAVCAPERLRPVGSSS